MKIKAQDYKIHNRMEDAVDLALEELLSEDPSICGCPLCRTDMKSLILNRINPQYYGVSGTNNEQEEVNLDLLESDLFNEILVESYRAVLKVKEDPRHNREKAYLQNSTEEIVLGCLNEILREEKRDFAKSELSTLMATVMNNLRPRYTTTPKGSAFSRTSEVDPSYVAEVYAHIFNAFKTINIKV